MPGETVSKPAKRKEKVLLRWVTPFFDPVQMLRAFPRYVAFSEDMRQYAKLESAELIDSQNVHPCIHDKTQTTSFDAHYFYQDIWAFKKIYGAKTEFHVDVGSRIDFVGFLTAITHVTFIDIRPLTANLDNFNSRKGSILAMPYKDNSVHSLSCLHVAEHIGLGRYGDPLDPLGTKKSCRELTRILADNGNLYFSLPLGRPRLCFNAHRIHSPSQIVNYFSGLDIVEFSGIDDNGNFIRNAEMEQFENMNYACGLFHFTKNP
jgi:hypothetical protein